MFVRACVELPLPVERLAGLLTHDPERWIPGLAASSEELGDGLLLQVGFPIDNHRLAPVAIEPRAVLAVPDPLGDGLTIWVAAQGCISPSAAEYSPAIPQAAAMKTSRPPGFSTS